MASSFFDTKTPGALGYPPRHIQDCVWCCALLCLILAACRSPETRSSGAPPPAALMLRPREALAVIGVKQDESQHMKDSTETVQDRRIGFGINTLLAESLFETGQFRLVEEKDVRQRELLDDLVRTYWVEPRSAYAAHELSRVATQLGVAVLAYGSIAYSGARSQRIALGPLSRTEQKVLVHVTACLYEAATRILLCREGQGEARQEGVGVVYEFRDDGPNFENNAVGRATKQAVGLAVRHLVASVRFAP